MPRERDEGAALPPQTYHVLLAIGEAPMHGYAIIQAYEALTGGRETLLPGSLYATLLRMAAEGLLKEVAPPAHEVSAGPTRRYFRITPAGRAAARAESRRRAALLAVAEARGLGAGRRSR
jgi:DNA-binding PadR family transcriptional regulator